MINTREKTLLILPHLDDEFALAPLIRAIIEARPNSLKIIYCAERLTNSTKLVRQRRSESLKSLKLLGCNEKDIYYLNDNFRVDDLGLIDAAESIYSFLEDFTRGAGFKQIVTLNLEGGHPDHDALAMVVNKFGRTENILTFFIPTYNYERGLLIPLSVFTPLQGQRPFSSFIEFARFCWFDSLKVAFVYKSERAAFIKLLPFILVRALFFRGVYVTLEIDARFVDWEKSLTLNRYGDYAHDFLKKIDKYK